MFIFLIGISIFIEISNAYVLLQVRKQNDNLSNIDALIHKVVPSDKIDVFAQKLARKQFHGQAKPTDYSDEKGGAKQTIDYSNNEKKGGKLGKDEISLSIDENSNPNLAKWVNLANLAIQQFTKDSGPVLRVIKPKGGAKRAIDYSDNEKEGGKPGKGAISLSIDENSNPNLVKLVHLANLAIRQFTKEGSPVVRASSHDKPKTVKFRTGESSALYEINSQSLIRGFEDLLSSKLVQSYIDSLTKKAAFVYRAMKESK